MLHRLPRFRSECVCEFGLLFNLFIGWAFGNKTNLLFFLLLYFMWAHVAPYVCVFLCAFRRKIKNNDDDDDEGNILRFGISLIAHITNGEFLSLIAYGISIPFRFVPLELQIFFRFRSFFENKIVCAAVRTIWNYSSNERKREEERERTKKIENFSNEWNKDTYLGMWIPFPYPINIYYALAHAAKIYSVFVNMKWIVEWSSEVIFSAVAVAAPAFVLGCGKVTATKKDFRNPFAFTVDIILILIFFSRVHLVLVQ